MARVHWLYVGIACFYFSTSPNKLSTWAGNVRSRLASISSLSEIEVAGDGSSGHVFMNNGVVPIHGRVSFKVEIPMEIQATYMGGLAIDLEVEKFWVHTLYERYGPVTYVVSEATSDPLVDASDHVVVVREYLKDQLARDADSIYFNILAPSPFHADLSLTIGHEKKQLSGRRTPTGTFDKFEFTASSELYGDTEDAVPDFLYQLSSELSLYYKLAAAYEKRLRAVMEINRLTERLLAIYETSSVKAWLVRTFTFSSRMRHLALVAIKEQYDNQAEATRSREEIEGIYATGIEPHFKDYLMTEMSKNFTDNVSAAREIASLLDQARGRQIGTIALFFSALAGGLAGALVSLLVR